MMRLFLLLLCLASAGCSFWRSETKTDSEKEKNSVTKETRVVKGTGEWDHTETVYREETTKEVAHAEQSKDQSSPVAQDILSAVGSGAVTGNPILDLILMVIGGKLGLNAANGVSAAGSAVVSKFKKPVAEKKNV